MNESSPVIRPLPRWLWPGVGAVGCVTAGVVCGLISVSTADGAAWYQTLQKPPGTPPAGVFGPVWTGLYLLMGISIGLLVNRRAWAAVRAFALQLALNLAWSPVFFGMHRIAEALGIICLLWGLILVTIQLARRVDAMAAWLLVPYGAWISYAAYLNAGIYVLNG